MGSFWKEHGNYNLNHSRRRTALSDLNNAKIFPQLEIFMIKKSKTIEVDLYMNKKINSNSLYLVVGLHN